MYKKHFSNVLGKHGANWSMLLNVIYMVVPLWITKKVLDKPSNLKVKLFILLHDSTIKFVCFSKLSHKFCRNDLILKYWVLWFAALQELSIFHMKWNCFFFSIQGNSGNESILKRPFDIVTILLLLSTMFIYIFKGLVSISEWFRIKCNAVILYTNTNILLAQTHLQ